MRRKGKACPKKWITTDLWVMLRCNSIAEIINLSRQQGEILILIPCDQSFIWQNQKLEQATGFSENRCLRTPLKIDHTAALDYILTPVGKLNSLYCCSWNSLRTALIAWRILLALHLRWRNYATQEEIEVSLWTVINRKYINSKMYESTKWIYSICLE